MLQTIRQNLIWILVAVCALGVATALLFPSPLSAAGHIGISNVKQELRTRYFETALYVLDNASGNTNDITAGREGVLAAPTLNGVTSLSVTTFERPPYPCKLALLAKEATDNGTLACTGATRISGLNQFGIPITETITSSIVEATPVISERVYEVVTQITTSACSGGAEANDVFRVACSNWVGLPFPITAATAVLAVNAIDVSANTVSTYTSTDLTTSETDIDVGDAAVNGGGLVGETPEAYAGTLADGDRIGIWVRAPAGL